MAIFRVESVEARPDKRLACDTFVKIETEVDDGEGGTTTVQRVVGHFTVILDAVAVNAVKGTKPQRMAQYLNMLKADPRIAGIIDAEAAAAKLQADVSFPVEVTV